MLQLELDAVLVAAPEDEAIVEEEGGVGVRAVVDEHLVQGCAL